MLDFRLPRAWRGPPLVLQILALLVGGLIVAQAATLFLTLLLPPVPSAQHSLEAVAAMLQGEPTPGKDRLERSVQAAAPSPAGPGWIVSERSRQELADLLDADVADVRLTFYTPLPFAGTSSGASLEPPASEPVADNAPAVQRGFMLAAFNGGPGPGPGFGGGAQGRGERGMPHDRNGDRPSRGNPGDSRPSDADRGSGELRPARPDGGTRTRPAAPFTGRAPEGRRDAGRPASGDASHEIQRDSLGLNDWWQNETPFQPGQLPRATIVQVPETSPAIEKASPERLAAAPAGPPRVVAPVPADAVPHAAVLRPLPQRQTPEVVTESDSASVAPRGLFGLAPAAFVEGDFVAALRLPDGRWAVARPVPQSFPNAWQSRVLLWFALSFALVAPFGWLFARRIVKPLSGFAVAAEQLGRDPSALVLQLDGPAEIGRAAHAFNLMQSRLKSFVDDRTAMVGAISHDLRTPLTRLRFRIEDVEDAAVRDGMTQEVAEMEAMITSVLGFIRDASVPGVRERLDFRAIVEDVAEDAKLIGSDVRLEAFEAAQVEVDVLGMRRLLGNLVDNAVKYGHRARIRLVVDADEAWTEISDDGPGLPEDELERAFEPFYRSQEARNSDKTGSGLGLAVCRSIARAHGGDVRLIRSDHGFVAQLRVPLVFDAGRSLAA